MFEFIEVSDRDVGACLENQRCIRGKYANEKARQQNNTRRRYNVTQYNTHKVIIEIVIT